MLPTCLLAFVEPIRGVLPRKPRGFLSRAAWTTMIAWMVIQGIALSSLSLHAEDAPSEKSAKGGTKSAIFAAGCFWCGQSDFEKAPGVIEVISGYSGGKLKNPTYETYAKGGHREVIMVVYNPAKITFAGLVEFLIKHIDPVDRGGSFVDRGTKYAPAIYVADEEERRAAEQVIDAIDEMKIYRRPINMPILARGDFWPAEDYHQFFHRKNPDQYARYRSGSGRDEYIVKHWGNKAAELTLPNAYPVHATGDDAGEKSETSKPEKGEANQGKPWESFKKPKPAELRKKLTGMQYKVTQESATETAFKNPFWNQHEAGIFVDVVSGEPLFASTDKFDSGTGWPSFVKPLVADHMVYREDKSENAVRTEVRSRYGDSHLGHVFSDGPQDRGGMRYCINSASLRFIPKAKLEKEGYGMFLPLFEKAGKSR